MLFEKTDVFMSIKPSARIVVGAHNQMTNLNMSTTCLLYVKHLHQHKNHWTTSYSVKATRVYALQDLMKCKTKYSHFGKDFNINFPQDVYDHVVNTGVTHSSSIVVLYLFFFYWLPVFSGDGPTAPLSRQYSSQSSLNKFPVAPKEHP